MFCVAVALSPSLSVIVAVSVTRLSADSVVDWSGSGVRRVHHCAELVQRHVAGAVHRHREHQGVAGRRAAFNRRAVQDQVHRLVGRRVDQTRRASH